MENGLSEIPPVRLIARPERWITKYIEWVLFVIFFVGWGVGLWQGTKWERKICAIKVKSVEEQKAMLAGMITKAFEQGKRRETIRLAKELPRHE